MLNSLRRSWLAFGPLLAMWFATSSLVDAAPADRESTSARADKSASGRPVPLSAPPRDVAGSVKLTLVTADAFEPVALVAAPEPKGRLFVVEKNGPIRILRGGKLLPRPFLDLTGRVGIDKRDNGEMGLLGLAFHPQFARNGRLYVNYTDLRGDTRIVEYRVDRKTPDRVDPSTARLLLMVDQPFSNHNAGHLTFGTDGKLYIALGDGGAADDPRGNGQNDATLLGKLLRLDVEQTEPVVDVIGKGLRNPWRYDFDRQTGDLYIADVGQNAWEYVHVVPAKSVGTFQNFGWNVTEGLHCFKGKPCDQAKYTRPAIEYSHAEGCSISGGHVYRGKALPRLVGHYFYADFCTALLRSFRMEGGKAVDQWDWKTTLDPDSKLARLTGFGQDQDGELYLVSHEGSVYQLTAAAIASR